MRVLLVAVVASCSSSAAAPSTPRTYDEAQAMLVEARCDRRIRCGEIGASERGACLADPDDARSMGYGPAWFREQTDAIARGRLRFDPSAFAGCLGALRGPCTAEPTCKLLVANVKPGGACTRWDECIDGHCSAQIGCSGRCIAHGKLGDACGPNVLCDDATFCGDNGHCIAKLPSGATCRAWNSCRDGLQCVGAHTEREEPGAPEVDVPGTCTAPGGACKPGWLRECPDALACDFATKQCTARVAKGGACRSPYTCADGLACAGLEAMWDPHTGSWRVGTPGRCIPPLDLGAHCDVLANPLATGCPGTATCDPKTETCVHAALAGNACEPNGGCRGNLYCSPAKICTPRLAFGAACTPPPEGGDDPCSLGRCDRKRHVCVPLQACDKS